MTNVFEEKQKEYEDDLKRKYRSGSGKGCLPTLYRDPILIEPVFTDGPPPPEYNRNTDDVVVLKVFPSPLDIVTPDNAGGFLERMQGIQEPVSFEIIGTNAQITVQLVMQKRDRRIVESAFDAICNHSYLKQTSDFLFTSYQKMASNTGKPSTDDVEFQFNDYYIRPPYYFPLNTPHRDFSQDPLESICSLFSRLQPGELGFYQAIFTPATKWDWKYVSQKLLSMRIPVSLYDDTEIHPVLSDITLKEHTAKATEKMRYGKPFFAASLRSGVFAHKVRITGILKTITNTLNVLVPENGQFQFLTRKDYYNATIPEDLHYYIFFNRVSLREGMLLTSSELSGLIHFPTTQSLERNYPIELARGRRPVPQSLKAENTEGIVIGTSPYKGESTTVVLKHKIRAQHCHIVGSTGYGKSTLIENSVIEDIKQGTGVCLIDPHGDLIEKHVLPKIPPGCMDNVIYFDPIRTPIPLNILEARNARERIALADDVVSIFKRYTDSWGVQIEEILGFGVQAILSSKEGGHLGTLHKFLLYPNEREKYLETIEDAFVLEFWRDQFPQFPQQKSAITTATRRLNQLLRSPVLQDILAKKENAINFREVMDQGKILLINLPLGELGATNAYILGSLIISKIQAAALTRQDIPEDQRKPFYLYIDEFQHFLCQSIEESLTGTRKYGLGLILAHNSIGQIMARDRAVSDTVLEVPNTRICFRVGDGDAVDLAKGFSHYTAKDLTELKTGEVIMRVGGSSDDFELNTRYDPPDTSKAKEIKEELIQSTLTRFGIAAKYQESKDSEYSDFIPPASEPSKTVTDSDAPPEEKKPPSDYIRTDAVSGIVLNLNPEEKRFLGYLAELARLLPVRYVYKELELSTHKGNSLKNRLLKAGFIAETEADLGKSKRKSKILALTSKGYGALGLPSLPGKGGPLHQFLQKIIAQRAKLKGYVATIEEVSLNGSQVDIGLSKDNKKIAVEVSVTTRPEQIVNNIVIALQGGYDDVISLFTLSETLSETKKLLSGSAQEIEGQKIKLRLVSEYESVL